MSEEQDKLFLGKCEKIELEEEGRVYDL